MCDYDAVENEDVVKLIVLVDRRLKSLFFGAISKELAKLAQGKLLQQAALLSDSIFAAFSNADDSLIDELLKMREATAAPPASAATATPAGVQTVTDAPSRKSSSVKSAAAFDTDDD